MSGMNAAYSLWSTWDSWNGLDRQVHSVRISKGSCVVRRDPQVAFPRIDDGVDTLAVDK